MPPAATIRYLPSLGKTRVAIIGVGAFGRNHARVASTLAQRGEPVALAGVFDTNSARASKVAGEFKTQAFATMEELTGRVDAACVAAPTSEHLRISRALMDMGIDVLVEKPVALSLAETDELISTARRTGRIAQVGHLERFNPAVRACAPLVTTPMFFEVHRLSVFTPRSLDIDVVLDLMIHDLDIVLSFVGSPLKEVRAVGLPILTPKVDIANVRLEFESGCVANLTASRVSTERVRKLRFFQPHQYISIDYSRQDVLVFSVDANAREAVEVQPGTVSSPNPGIGVQKPRVVNEEPLEAELRAFINSVRTRSEPVVTLEDGRRALVAALEILAEIHAHGERINLAAVRG
jgi:predicted dehydrogenase